MGREPILMASCGKKGVGKSYTTMKYMRDYVKGNPAKAVPGRKVLIFDVNNEYSDKAKFPDIRALHLKDVPLFAARPVAEIRRIAPWFENGLRMTLRDMAEVLQWVVRNYYDGLLLVEDINKYVSDNMPSDLIGAICTNRHAGVDMILHYQSIGRLTPKVWQNINVLRMHKNSDSVDRHQNKFEDKYECLKIAEKIVWTKYRDGDNRFYLHINFDDEKIYGTMSDQEIKTAISEYIAENSSSLLNKHINMVTKQGSKTYTRESAFTMEEDRIFQTYF